MRRRRHGRNHDLLTLAAAVGAITAAATVAIAVAPTEDPVPPASAVPSVTHDRLVRAESRGTARTTPPTPQVVVRATHTPAAGGGNGEEPPSAAGLTWPNYRALANEPSYVQAAAQCVISHESRYAGMYQAINPAGPWYGAYQFSQSTWTSVTGLTGAPTSYAPVVQDDAFATLWNRGAGAGHWAGSGC